MTYQPPLIFPANTTAGQFERQMHEDRARAQQRQRQIEKELKRQQDEDRKYRESRS